MRKIVRLIEQSDAQVLQITQDDFRLRDIQAVNFDFKFERQSENEFVYAEKLGFKNKLYIIGGGHCALALSELMSKMDFHILASR
jgi:xanthine dehydrogenase accessory factor